MAKEDTVNVTLTLPVSLVVWIDGKAHADFDGNRSQAARKVLRDAKAREDSLTKLVPKNLSK